LFEEDQVVLTPEWKNQRVLVHGSWNKLRGYRLGDIDLFLSKLMRNDPQDIADAKFLAKRLRWDREMISHIISLARAPDIPENPRAICYLHRSFFATNAAGKERDQARLGSDRIR
jgi:hypothetical protein